MTYPVNNSTYCCKTYFTRIKQNRLPVSKKKCRKPQGEWDNSIYRPREGLGKEQPAEGVAGGEVPAGHRGDEGKASSSIDQGKLRAVQRPALSEAHTKPVRKEGILAERKK